MFVFSEDPRFHHDQHQCEQGVERPDRNRAAGAQNSDGSRCYSRARSNLEHVINSRGTEMQFSDNVLVDTAEMFFEKQVVRVKQ